MTMCEVDTSASIVEGLLEAGFAVEPDFLPGDVVSALAADAVRLDRSGSFRSAGTGANAIRSGVRGDRIAWLEPGAAFPAALRFWQRMEALRLDCNRELQLGLFDCEAHFAVYAPGAAYARHRDRLEGSSGSRRVLSCVLYLNEVWRDGDGGALRLYTQPPREIAPRAGTFVCFLSDRLEHEVLPARRERWSLACWMRNRGGS